MRKIRLLFAVLLILLLLVAVAAMAGLWQIERMLARANIHQLDYRIESVGFRQAHFEKFAFVYLNEAPQSSPAQISSQVLPVTQDSSLQLAVQEMTVHWRWDDWFSPQLTLVTVEDAHLTRRTNAGLDTAAADTSDFNLPNTWELPSVLPERITVENLTLNLPCLSSEFCTLSGTLAAHREVSTMTLNLRLSPGQALHAQHQLQLMLKYGLSDNLPDLSARLIVEDDLDINLRTQLTGAKSPLLWSGRLTGKTAPLDDVWRIALASWNIRVSDSWQKSAPQMISINSHWQLAFDPLLAWINSPSVNPWQEALTGSMALDIDLPVPVGVDAVGEFSGQLNGELEAADGALTHYEINAKVTAANIAIPDNLRAAGIALDQLSFTLQSRADEPLGLKNFNNIKNFTRLPLTLSVQGSGEVNAQLDAQLRIDLAAAAVNIESASLQANAKAITVAEGIVLDKPELKLDLHGELSPKTFSLIINEKSELQGSLHAPDFSLDINDANISSPDFVLQGNIAQGKPLLSSMEFAGNISLTAKQLLHPQVKPAPWQWRGNAVGEWEDFLLTGKLQTESVNLTHQLQRKASRAALNWQIDNIFLLAGNPFATIFTAWPELLTLSQGKANAKGNLHFDIDSSSLVSSDSQIALQDIKGIYDTTLFDGLTAELRVETQGEKLTLGSDNVKIKTINKGFVGGPFDAAGNYQAEFENLSQGRLNLQRLQGKVMDGSVSIAAQQFDLSQPKQTFVVDVKAIDLTSLLKQYPSSELSGDGRISGQIPISWSDQGISIAKGAVAAEPPGGRIHYESERVRNLANSQQSLQIVTKALEDFHYTVLASELSYDESGQLMLSLRLEGRNPAVENGRPINFNINIEEDLPALIASIQLSSQLSDKIKNRIQEGLQNRKQNKTPATNKGK